MPVTGTEPQYFCHQTSSLLTVVAERGLLDKNKFYSSLINRYSSIYA